MIGSEEMNSYLGVWLKTAAESTVFKDSVSTRISTKKGFIPLIAQLVENYVHDEIETTTVQARLQGHRP